MGRADRIANEAIRTRGCLVRALKATLTPMIGLRINVFLASLSLCSCSVADRTPLLAFRNPVDALLVRTGLNGVFDFHACTHRERQDGLEVLAYVPADQCYVFGESERFSGSWQTGRFKSDFVADQTTRKPNKGYIERHGWLIVDRAKLPADLKYAREKGPRTFSLAFIGRRSKYSGSYGHTGSIGDIIIVDRLISILATTAPSPADRLSTLSKE
jgi:hypothetical protein